jgi:hypothetical protein
MVNLYLLGLNEVFDHVRFEIQKLIKNKKMKAPKTMAAARKMVEDWAVQMKDRGLMTFKGTTGADPMSPNVTMLGEVETTSTLEPTTVTESTNKDFSSFTCNWSLKQVEWVSDQSCQESCCRLHHASTNGYSRSNHVND